jgi:Protein of unknown function (DUF3303)
VLFLVVERFPLGLDHVRGRFERWGRMLPDGVTYQASWLDPAGTICYQLMDAPDRTALDAWVAKWSDIVSFEITPVVPSVDFWARR